MHRLKALIFCQVTCFSGIGDRIEGIRACLEARAVPSHRVFSHKLVQLRREWERTASRTAQKSMRVDVSAEVSKNL